MTYQGGGEVSSANAIYVSLFDSPTVDNQPLAFQVVSDEPNSARRRANSESEYVATNTAAVGLDPIRSASS